MKMQMLVDGEWVDIAAASEITFTPTSIEETTTPEPLRTSYSMSLDFDAESASTLRVTLERLEREVRAERWRRRLWLRYPFRY